MATHWSAVLPASADCDRDALRAALQQAVDEVDAQMSLWKPESALMRLNRAEPGVWVDLPERILAVLELGLAVGRASGGAFDIGLGDAVCAWGFGPGPADPARIRAALSAPRRPAHDLVELDLAGRRARKHAPLTLDLNGIAKGHGVDRLAETLRAAGIAQALVGIDGEMRALGTRPGAAGWHVAIEAPDPARRAALSMLVLADAAVATSGDYRHRLRARDPDGAALGRWVSHTIDPRRGVPLADPPASVTVLAPSCALADAWATALMVLGPGAGAGHARAQGLDALFLLRKDGGGVRPLGIGPVFAPQWSSGAA